MDIDGFVGDGKHGRIGAAAGDRRHDGGIDDPQAFDAAHLEVRRDDGVAIGLAAHPAGDDGMIVRLDGASAMRRERLVRHDVRSRKDLPVDHAPHRARRQNLPGIAQTRDGQAQILRVAEESRIDLRRGERIGRCQAHRPARPRPQEARIQRHAVGRLDAGDIAVEIDRRHAVELRRRPCASIGIDEGAGLNAGRGDGARLEQRMYCRPWPIMREAAILAEATEGLVVPATMGTS